ncbi:hypothetical protein O3S80_49170 [Streptomyces sp. Lzd4kr]|nr:hypothetical protein [Streptomyces sp. Lzd4kr]
MNILPRYCHDCDVRFACHGGWTKDRFDTTPDGAPGLNHLCAGFKAFFHHVDRPMHTMAGLLRQGRAPALIMSEYASADADRPYNTPCPCEGGRKWGPLPRQAGRDESALVPDGSGSSGRSPAHLHDLEAQRLEPGE